MATHLGGQKGLSKAFQVVIPNIQKYIQVYLECRRPTISKSRKAVSYFFSASFLWLRVSFIHDWSEGKDRTDED